MAAPNMSGRRGGARNPGRSLPEARRMPQPLQPREGGTLFQRARLRTLDYLRRGELWQRLEEAALVVGGVGGGIAAASDRPAVKQAGAAVALFAVPAVTLARRRHDAARVAYRALPDNPENVKRMAKVTDPDWLRALDHRFVDGYSIDPRWMERKLGMTTVGTAQRFASMRVMRKRPFTLTMQPQTEGYIIARHESTPFAGLVRPLLQFMTSQLPASVDAKAILDYHYPKENLKPMTLQQVPAAVKGRTLKRILSESPQTPEEAVSLALLGAAVAKRNILEEEGRLVRR